MITMPVTTEAATAGSNSSTPQANNARPAATASRSLARPPQQPAGGDATDDRARALRSDQDAEERRRPVEALVDDREQGRLGEADDQQRDRRGQHDLREHWRPADVPKARGRRGPPALTRPWLGVSRGDPDEHQGHRCDHERRRVEHRDRPAADRREQGRADERGN
jgi:hypothetical protein